jgi:ComF family protein
MFFIFKKLILILLRSFCDIGSVSRFNDEEGLEKNIWQKSILTLKNDWIVYIFKYKDSIIKESIWQLKFRGQKDIGILYGKILFKKLLVSKFFKNLIRKINLEKIIFFPVPIDKQRKIERGFNQSAVVLKSFEKEFKKVTNLEIFKNIKIIFDYKSLYKIKATKKQSWKNKKERLSENENFFKLKKIKINQKTLIIILDDVVTTGATLKKIRKIFSENIETHDKNLIKFIGLTIAG